MASQQLKFQIGSAFSGEGFKAAQQSVGALNKSVTQGAGVVNQLTSAIGGMDGTAGKAARALAGMLNAFMSMNPVLIGVTAAIGAVTWAMNELNEREKKAQEQAEELRKSREKLATTLNEAILRRAIEDANALAKEFERITRHANELAAAMRSLDRERAQGGILAIQAEKVVAVMNEVSDEARQMVAAEYDYKIALQKAAVARANGEADVAKAHQDIIDEENRIANLARQRAAVEEQVAHLENNIAYAKKHQLSTIEEDEKKMAQLRAKIADIDAKSLAAKEKIQVLQIAEQTATAKLNNALVSAQMEVDGASDKIEQLKRHSAELAEKEAEQAAKIEEENRQKAEKAERDAKAKELQQEAATLQREVNDAAKDVAAAEKAYAEALAKYEANFADNKMAEGVFGATDGKKSKMSIPVRIDGSIKAEVVAKDLETAMKDGLIKSVRDMDKFNRDRAKALDVEEKRKWQQLEREKQKYDQLTQTNRKSWSKADADFARKFEMLKEAAEAKKREVQEAKQNLQAAQQREKDNHDNLRTIKDRLEKLGLK